MNDPKDAATHEVLWSVSLAGNYVPTGKTTHSYKNEKLDPPASLQIARYPDGDGYYLFYLDDNGQEMTDTYHDEVEGAMDQAKFEFSVPPSAWTKGE